MMRLFAVQRKVQVSIGSTVATSSKSAGVGLGGSLTTAETRAPKARTRARIVTDCAFMAWPLEGAPGPGLTLAGAAPRGMTEGLIGVDETSTRKGAFFRGALDEHLRVVALDRRAEDGLEITSHVDDAGCRQHASLAQRRRHLHRHALLWARGITLLRASHPPNLRRACISLLSQMRGAGERGARRAIFVTAGACSGVAVARRAMRAP